MESAQVLKKGKGGECTKLYGRKLGELGGAERVRSGCPSHVHEPACQIMHNLDVMS